MHREPDTHRPLYCYSRPRGDTGTTTRRRPAGPNLIHNTYLITGIPISPLDETDRTKLDRITSFNMLSRDLCY